MKTRTLFALGCLLVIADGRLAGQAAAEYGATAAASTTGAAAGSKGVSKSIGGVFEGIGKKLDKAAGDVKSEQAAKAAPSTPAATGKNKPQTTPSATKAAAPRLIKPSQVRIGMTREELITAVGRPSMKTSGADEGVFRETYMYQGEIDTVTVTLHAGKVTGVSPSPEEESVTAPAFATPPQTQSKAERPQ